MKILIAGLPFYAHKYGYLINAYASLGFKVDVLFNSAHENVPSEVCLNKALYAGHSPFGRIYRFVKAIREEEPDYIDFYDYSILTVIFLLISKFFSVKSRLWLIGGELKNDISHLNKPSFLNVAFVNLKTLFTKLSVLCVDSILAKELHHVEDLHNLTPRMGRKTVLLYNCVPVKDVLHVRKFSELNDFIHANAVIESRNVDKLIHGLNQLKHKGVGFDAALYGFNSIANDVYAERGVTHSNNVLKLYHNYNLVDCVSVHGFESDILSKFVNYKFFILFGDVIFANYALLEAMSQGLVPIVFPGNGYEKIVKDGHNGIVVQEGHVEQALVRALNLSECEYSKMSQNAHEKIKNEFSIDLWKSKLESSFD